MKTVRVHAGGPAGPGASVIPNPAAASWPLAPAAARRARRRWIGLLAVLAIVLTAAWAVPPMLDWNRFRTAIAAIAGAQLGRTVVIGGDVTLRLLPQAVLTANDVTVPDRGDGMSARIASLRLEVGLGPLLAGRLVVRDLVLGSPVLTLPWPLPDGIVNPARPHVPHPFAAHVENGTLRAGQTEITGITAAIHGGPVATDAPGAGPVAAFGAEGFAAFDGQRWRFTTALGAPDADGVSAVDLAVQGLGPAHDTGGAIQGTLANGVLQGRLNAAGPDLSLLMPASSLAWRAEAPFTASGERIGSDALSLSLGGAPATAGFTLQLAAPTRLDAHLSAASLDLDGWSRLLSGKFASFAVPAIPMRLDLSAGGASLLGGTLGALSGTLVFDGAHATMENVRAGLPGGASLRFSGKVERAPRALTLDGPASLQAPDLHATLAWLRPLAPTLLDALPAKVLRQASLTGDVKLSPGHLAVGQMAGRLDAAAFSGGFDLTLGAHPALKADAKLDRLDIDAWLDGAQWHPGMSLKATAESFIRTETALHVAAASASWRGHSLTGVEVDAATGEGGLRIDRAAATLPNASLAVSGALAADGKLSAGRLHLSTQDVAAFVAGLPEGWRWPTGPLHGPAELTATADGAPDALDLQVRAVSGDLVLEADQRRNTLAGVADTTLTLRHPGAPFLLAQWGLPGADAWLGMGSMALLAHLHSTPGSVSAGDVTLDAADLHLRGHGDMTYAGAAPSINVDLVADGLALPGLPQFWRASLPSFGLPPAWQAHVHLNAARVALGPRQVAENVAADIKAAQRAVLLDLTKATVAGGVLSAQFAFDSGQVPAKTSVRASLTRASVPGQLTGWPVDMQSGVADLDLDLLAAGNDLSAMLPTLAGTAQVSLRNAVLSGFSLALLDRSLEGPAPPSRAVLQGALSQGETDGLSGTADVAIENGRASVGNASLVSTEGSVVLNGVFEAPAGKLNLAVGVTPVVPGGKLFTIRMAGAGADVKSAVDLGASEPASRKPAKKPARRTKRAG